MKDKIVIGLLTISLTLGTGLLVAPIPTVTAGDPEPIEAGIPAQTLIIREETSQWI